MVALVREFPALASRTDCVLRPTQTDDAQNIYMSWRGIAHPQQGGALYARTTPLFETAAAKYAWLNNVVAVGVYRPGKGKIAYRVYQIL
jgi:hypothetical protein